jgi:hypothetical protein
MLRAVPISRHPEMKRASSNMIGENKRVQTDSPPCNASPFSSSAQGQLALPTT